MLDEVKGPEDVPARRLVHRLRTLLRGARPRPVPRNDARVPGRHPAGGADRPGPLSLELSTFENSPVTTELKRQALDLVRQFVADPAADFRDGQWEAIASLSLRRARLLVIQRTGWGKSLVYFVTTRLLRERGAGPTLLISPLLSLMRNQILAAERLGLRAYTINSSNVQEWADVEARVRADDVDVLLISPERLASGVFQENVLRPIAQHIGFFVVDEAHCISDWGHDFRPDYRRLARVLDALPQTIPVLATTATANDRVASDVLTQLGANMQVVRGPLARQSLRLQTMRLPRPAERMAWLAEQVPRLPGSGIIYTLTVGDAHRLARWLRSQGLDVQAYAADVPAGRRHALEQQLLNNAIKALVATPALAMGFDKPDLGFVIHYQRPASAVHYYQQVGRAGRAIDHAYGILLSGFEDWDITAHLMRTAFPPDDHVEQVLGALQQAGDGLSAGALQQRVNLSTAELEKVLRSLAVMSPAPIARRGDRWHADAASYAPARDQMERQAQVRREEQVRMRAYVKSQECLMLFLTRELDDPAAAPCGQCAVCRGSPLLPWAYSFDLAARAEDFLWCNDQEITSRKQWPLIVEGSPQWQAIPPRLRAAQGRALCHWGDDGWGIVVRRGKLEDERFDDALVTAVVIMIRERWRPHPGPTWVTCVPSLHHPELVPDFARRVARALELPFVASVRKTRPTQPQKQMQNSYVQAYNLHNAFAVDPWEGLSGPVLLVDDMVDSGWTFTVIAARLRHAGSGPVFPLALAVTAKSGRSSIDARSP